MEGEMDKLAFEEAGFLNVVSVPDGAPQVLSPPAPLQRLPYLLARPTMKCAPSPQLGAARVDGLA